MKIKKYRASTMPEVMKKIRAEMGSNAVILNSKEVKEGGFLGFFQKKKLEIIAAYDPDPLAQDAQHQVQKKIPTPRKDKKDNEVLDELRKVKQLIRTNVNQQRIEFPKEYQELYVYLLAQEVADEYAREIIHDVMNKAILNPSQSSNIRQNAEQIIEKKIHPLMISEKRYDKKIIHFVGPTGVGKTTTIAKIAAKTVLQDKKKVALITTDTYRIAAIEQLKTYATILNLPLEVAYTMQDYQRAIDAFQDADLILVDTAGRNFRESKYIKELANRIDIKKDVLTYLVLSLTSKLQDLLDLQNIFKEIPIEAYIFTKLDETRSYGSILTMLLKGNIGVSYLSNGQNVPNDLIIPSANDISRLMMEDYRNG